MAESVAVVSGYFSPLHVGHLRMIVAASALADRLVVIVNNDAQQVRKKGRVITPAVERAELVAHLREVDSVLVAVDEDATVRESLRVVRRMHPEAVMVFANGGDRSDAHVVPEEVVCAALGIRSVYGVGGREKSDSSSRLIEEHGL